MLANAVALFVLAGAVFFGILSLQQTGLLAISEDGAAAIAMACATIVSAIGVLIAVQRDRSFVGVKHLTEGAFTRNPLVSSWATRQRAERDGARTRALSIAVALWIIAPIPLMVLTSLADIFGRPTVDLSGLGLTIACVLVAVGLRIYLPTTWAAATYKTLVDPDNEKHRPDGTTTAKAPRLVSVIAGPYWLLLLAGYLTWSFVADAWDRSWIVWPIGAIAFGLLSAIFESVSQWKKYRESTR